MLLKYDQSDLNLPKKNRVHYLTDSVFDRYSLSRKYIYSLPQDRSSLAQESSQPKHSFSIFTLITAIPR